MVVGALRKKTIAVFTVSVILLLVLTAYVYNNNRNNTAQAATTSFRFVVIGDSQGSSHGINETALRGLLQQVKGLSVQPSFILFTGDQVEGDSNISTELAHWKNIVDDYYPITSYYPTLGNHEGDKTIFSNNFDYLPNEQLSGYKRTVYYFDHANARFFVLNSTLKDDNGEFIIGSAQRNWMESLLNNNGKTHNFVMFHCPAYPIGSHVRSSLDRNPADRDAFWELVDRYNVTAVFNGHEHNYNRRLVDSSFNANGRTFDHQIYQLTVGGGGASLDSTAKNMKNVMVGPRAVYHYMTVDIAETLATFNVYDKNNSLIDSFTVDHSATSITKAFHDGVYPSSSYEGTRDTKISQNAPTKNYGSSTSLNVDGDTPGGSSKDVYGLLKWDASSIPAGSTVKSAGITLNITNHSAGQAYELYEVKRNWSESSANWNQYSSGNKWEVAGAKGSSDRGATVLGTLAASSTGKYTITLNSAGVSLVQSWVNSPSSNFGIIIANNSNRDGVDFSSRENSTPDNRPKLTVIYTP